MSFANTSANASAATGSLAVNVGSERFLPQPKYHHVLDLRIMLFGYFLIKLDTLMCKYYLRMHCKTVVFLFDCRLRNLQQSEVYKPKSKFR